MYRLLLFLSYLNFFKNTFAYNFLENLRNFEVELKIGEGKCVLTLPRCSQKKIGVSDI